MKRAIVFVTLGMTVAGVASANVFTAAPPSVASQQQALEAPAVVAVPASPREVPNKPAATPKASGAPVVQKASVETRQAPVPLQVKPRPAVNLPESKSTGAKPDDPGSTQEAAAAPTDTFDEKAAKAAIEADGYKGVRVLRKGVNGVWHASALRGNATVPLVVDPSGGVSSAE